MSTHVFRRSAGWILIAILLVAAPVYAQGGQGSYPAVRDLDGALENLQIIIRGSVQNPLAVPISNVEVEIGFLMPDSETTRTVQIDRISASSSAEFEFKADSGISPLARFGAYVAQFTFETQNLDELTAIYAANPNGNVLNAMIHTFRQLDPDVIPDLRACIAPNSNALGDNQATIMDMLCVEGLVSLRAGEAVPDLLALGVWYDTQFGSPAQIFAMTADSEDSVINAFSYLAPYRAEAADLNNVDVMGFAIATMGSSAIPDLLRATQNPDSTIQRTARFLLVSQNILTAETLLAEPRTAPLESILQAIGETGYVEALPALLEVRAARPNLHTTLDASVAALGEAAIPGLIESLESAQMSTVEQAETLLLMLAETHSAALRELLPDESELADDSPGGLVDALRVHADTQIAAQAEEYFAASREELAAGDCTAARVLLDEGMAIREDIAPPPEGAAILACEARLRADEGVYAEAVALGQRAEILDPENEALQTEITSWLLAQTNRALELGLNNQAAELGKDVLIRDPNQRDLRVKLASLVLGSNVEYAVMGLLALGLAIALGILYKVDEW